MKWDFQPKPKTGVGLVADARSCELAVASAGGAAPKLIRRETPAPAAPNAPVVAQTPSRWLEQLKPELGKGRYRLATAVNSSELFCKRISLPTVDPAEVAQMAPLQVEKLSPLPLNDVVWSYEILAASEGRSDVLIVFGRKENLVQCVSGFGDEFLPDLIDVDLLLLWRGLRAKGDFKDKNYSGLLWIDVPSKVAKCVLLKGSTPLLIEHLALEGLDAAGLARAWSVMLLSAEANLGVGKLDALFLLCPADMHASVSAELATELRVSVFPVEASGSLSPAVGLAHRALRNGQAQVNLLPTDYVQRQQKKQFRQQAKFIGAIALAVYVLAILAFAGISKWRQFSMGRMEAKLKQLEEEYAKARLLQAEVNFLKQKLDDRRSALETLRAVSEALPAQSSLQLFNYRQTQGVDLRGTAQNDTDVNDLLRKLKESDLFDQVRTGPIKGIPGRGSEVTFEIVCTLAGAGKAGGK